MHRIALWTLAGLLLFISLSNAQKSPPQPGDPFPSIRLQIPEDSNFHEYLGLPAGASFTLPQIDAEIVIIEIFSMYCPHCQREAPNINRFYENIRKDPRFGGKVKLIGIGAGNSAFEVEHFRKTYQIPFPLFPDGDFDIHKKVGEVRTPYFIGVRLRDKTEAEVFFSELGGAKGAVKVLEKLISESGLEK